MIHLFLTILIVVISFKNFHYFSSFSVHYMLVFVVGDISQESRLLACEKPHTFPLAAKILRYISEILLLNSTMWSFFIDHGLLFSFFSSFFTCYSQSISPLFAPPTIIQPCLLPSFRRKLSILYKLKYTTCNSMKEERCDG